MIKSIAFHILKVWIQNYTIYKIGQDRKIADSQRYYQTIFEYYPKSNSILEIEKIANDLL